MNLQGPERRYDVDYADLANLVYASPVGKPGQGRGELLFGEGNAQLPSAQGVRLSGKLAELDLGPLFKAFPATQKITVQLIGPNGQKGLEATPNKATVAF